MHPFLAWMGGSTRVFSRWIAKSLSNEHSVLCAPAILHTRQRNICCRTAPCIPISAPSAGESPSPLQPNSMAAWRTCSVRRHSWRRRACQSSEREEDEEEETYLDENLFCLTCISQFLVCAYKNNQINSVSQKVPPKIIIKPLIIAEIHHFSF